MEKRPNPVDIFSTEKKWLHYSGLYKEADQKVGVIYYICRFITITFSICQFISMGMRIIIDRRDMSKVIETMYFFMTQIALVTKIFLFLLRQHKLKQFEDILTSDIFNTRTESQDRYLSATIKGYTRFAIVLKYMCLICVALYGIFPILGNKLLAVPAWFPMDIKKYHTIIYSFQVFSFFLCAYVSTTLDCITNALISMGSAQLEVLKNNLENCTTIDDKNSMNKEEIKQIIHARLTKCVIHHNETLIFIEKVISMFTEGVFSQFVNGLMVICLTGVQFIFIPIKSIEFVSLLLYLGCMVCQVAIYCWFGHDIMSKSADIGQACYMSDWHECDPETRKIIFIIMERAKRPVIITAVKIFPLTLNTLAMILKTSYSYYAVLRRMYSDEIV